MRTTVTTRIAFPFCPVARRGAWGQIRSRAVGWLKLSAAVALLSASAILAAQGSDTRPVANATAKPVHHKRHASAQVQPQVPDPPVIVTPPPPEPPKWPATDPAAEASVVWDSQGLRINASNSSLGQILKDVSMATGAKVDGLTNDVRVFGVYGPGQARDVLSQLLQGSGYDVIMIGDQGQGTPRQVLLSPRQAAPPQTMARNNPNNANEEDNEAEDPSQVQNQEQVPVRQTFPPGMPPRSPQQIMQERQQQQMQQQQPQQPNPPNY